MEAKWSGDWNEKSENSSSNTSVLSIHNLQLHSAAFSRFHLPLQQEAYCACPLFHIYFILNQNYLSGTKIEGASTIRPFKLISIIDYFILFYLILILMWRLLLNKKLTDALKDLMDNCVGNVEEDVSDGFMKKKITFTISKKTF